MIDLRLGEYAVLADVMCDLLLVDAPYSEKTHSGHDTTAKVWADGGERNAINYAPWHRGDVLQFVDFFAPRTRGWFVTITDAKLAPIWEDALEAHGRYVFPPIPFVEIGSRVRMSGDGPSNWTCWIIAARPRNKVFSRWGTLPGAYVGSSERKAVMGGKSLAMMRALVRDYSRPGDTVCDPCAGGATTLLAAAMEQRFAVGSERDEGQYAIGRARVDRPFTPALFQETGHVPEYEQLDLLGGGDASGKG